MISTTTPESYFTPLEELQGRLSTQDQLDCLALVARFEWCFDSRRFDALADMLTEDMVLDHVWGYAAGRHAAVALLQANVAINDGLRHASLNPTVYGEPDGTATALSYLAGVLVGDDTAGQARPLIGGHGMRIDRFRRDNGLWRMSGCVVDQMYAHSSFPITGDERARYRLTADQRDARQPAAAG